MNRHRAALSAVVLSATFVLQCATVAPHAGDDAVPTVMRLERALWDAWRTKDRAAFLALTDGAYQATGADPVAGLAEVAAAFDHFDLRGYELGPMTPLVVAGDVIILTYRAKIDGSYAGADVSRPVAEASVWVRRRDGWKNIMLHEVTIAPPPK